LGWPEEWLEYPVELVRPSGRFVSGVINWLWVDLANPPSRVAIEVAPMARAIHRQAQIDKWKQETLRSLGWTVLRFSNLDLIERRDSVLAEIRLFTTSR